MKKSVTIILLAACMMSLLACGKYLDVNNNIDTPDYIEAGEYLPGILSAYEGFYSDIQAIAPLSQMMGTSTSRPYYYFANNTFPSGSNAGGEIWSTVYLLQGMNLESMINQAVEGKMWTLAGIGYAIKAFSWDVLTKFYGEAPMKQAFKTDRSVFDYDYQAEIMEQVRKWAETAITYLEKEDKTDYGTYLSAGDLVYHGDRNKWIKFAHSVIVTDLAALSNKKDFAQKYAPELLRHAALAIDDNDSNFVVERAGGGSDAQYVKYNNIWGTARGLLGNYYWQSDYIVKIMTGTVPQYNETNGDWVRKDDVESKYEYKLAVPQIICDDSKATGHYDPRVIAKLCTRDGVYYDKMSDASAIKDFIFYGSRFTNVYGLDGYSAQNLYGINVGSVSKDTDGSGRWLFRDDAPYVLLTASEIQFDIAETYWKLEQKADALTAFRKAVLLDVEFAGKYLNPGEPKDDGNGGKMKGGGLPGGSQISVATYNTLAAEYVAGPYVNGLSENQLTLSHIMMQKYVALWPWGALEAWTDLRKYHFDLVYSGEYPTNGDGFDNSSVNQKWDTDPTKVYKGFYLAPAQVEDRKSAYNASNEGSPCYRMRPRYSSEDRWNKSALANLKPIAGDAPNYHCSIPWFAYPGDYPESL